MVSLSGCRGKGAGPVSLRPRSAKETVMTPELQALSTPLRCLRQRGAAHRADTIRPRRPAFRQRSGRQPARSKQRASEINGGPRHIDGTSPVSIRQHPRQSPLRLRKGHCFFTMAVADRSLRDGGPVRPVPSSPSRPSLPAETCELSYSRLRFSHGSPRSWTRRIAISVAEAHTVHSQHFVLHDSFLGHGRRPTPVGLRKASRGA
jgi:hypothetical protein